VVLSAARLVKGDLVMTLCMAVPEQSMPVKGEVEKIMMFSGENGLVPGFNSFRRK